MRHLLLILLLAGAALQSAGAADSPAQMRVGKRSIEELLRIPGDLKPGRYVVQCEAYIGTSGWALAVRCYAMSEGAPRSLQKAVAYSKTGRRGLHWCG